MINLLFSFLIFMLFIYCPSLTDPASIPNCMLNTGGESKHHALYSTLEESLSPLPIAYTIDLVPYKMVFIILIAILTINELMRKRWRDKMDDKLKIGNNDMIDYMIDR